MDQEMNDLGMLNLMVSPSFCVKDRKIVKCNSSARSLLLEEGMDILPLLVTGRTEYEEYTGGTLYLILGISGVNWGASVTILGDYHVFLLEDGSDQTELQAMALAARELRAPLSGIMATAEQLFPMEAMEDDPKIREQVARLNRGLYQMLRIICNMSDAEIFDIPRDAHMKTLEIRNFFETIFEKQQALMDHTGLTLHFENLSRQIYMLADREKLERAVLNMISNAIKFTVPGGTLDAKLYRRGNQLYFTLHDSGEGIPEAIHGTIHRRYLRKPGMEDSRFGIGLGMVLIRSAAAIHGGTVLIDHPDGHGTRITMTMTIRQNNSGNVHAMQTFLMPPDYTGERDHSLVELADILPPELYENV